MSQDFDVFAPAAPAEAARAPSDEQALRQEFRAASTRVALGHPAGRSWLHQRLAEEEARPSYRPGESFDQVAYAEGRKAMLREIHNELFQDPEA